MDKQTAIDLLDNLLGMVEDNHESDYDAALHMGIDALKSNASNALSALDCVERQAVINEIKDMYTAAEEWGQGAYDDDTKARAESCMATNVELKLRVEKMPSVQPQRWVPVSEALPKDDEEVIVTCLDDSGDTPFSYTTVAWHYKGMWVCENERCLFVVGWMPLPEPWMPLPEPWRGHDE